MRAAHLLVTVWCGQCSKDGRGKAGKNPAKLGTLYLEDGRHVWYQQRNRRKLRGQDHRLSDGGRLVVERSAPLLPGRQRLIREMLERRGHQLPPRRTVDWFPVSCPVHGDGSVSASDVLNASGNVELKIRATA